MIEVESVRPSLLLLHLSDIHFREPYCLNPDTDPDQPVRQALLNDIRTMVDRLGPVNATLLSGDIAFKANPQEYEVAIKWLSEVTRAAGCSKIDIYTVPGNHDVDRTIADGRMVQAVRKLISDKAPGPERDMELYETLRHEKSSIELLISMEKYNLFAASFRCDLTPMKPAWIVELPISPGWKLKMHGLTTTFLSGPGDDQRGELYLGALQRAFAADQGVVRLAMLHHPPDWLADQDEVDDALWDSCALHLLGHKHRQRYLPSENGIRLAAGAVNPSRTEGNWEPGYNFVKLQIVEEDAKYFLKFETHLRIWQDNPDRFIAKRTPDDRDVFEHKVRLWLGPSPIHTAQTEEISVMGGIKKESEPPSGTTEALENTILQRNLVFDFWQLTPSQRRQIMQELDLLVPSDDDLTEPQRYRLAFQRARERNLIDKLEDTVSQTLKK